jgi:hypothetical protein
MRTKIIMSLVGIGLFASSSALGDYVLVCHARASVQDVNVKGARSFEDACRSIAANPVYSAYTNCIDARGRSGACPLGGTKTKVKLTIVTRDVRAQTNPQYRNLELGGKVKAYPGFSNCPDFKFDDAPATYDLDPGDYTLCFATPTKVSDPNNRNCIYAPVQGITMPPVTVQANMTYTGYYKCQ